MLINAETASAVFFCWISVLICSFSVKCCKRLYVSHTGLIHFKLTAKSYERGRAMKDIAVDRIKDAVEDLIRDKKTLVKLLSIVLILLLAAVLRLHASNRADIKVEAAVPEISEEEPAAEDEEASSSLSIYVDISGAVASPGVYAVAPGTRLFEVVKLAGGLTESADTNSVNQAACVEDGEKVIIPDRNAAPGDAAAAPAEDPAAMRLININTAAKEELTTLNGIGDAIAGRIIEYRSANRFKSKEDIMSVKGIGKGIYEKIKDDITC